MDSGNDDSGAWDAGAETAALSLRLALRVAIGRSGAMFDAVMESLMADGIAGELSLRDIAQRHGVARSSLSRRIVRARASLLEACAAEGLDASTLLRLMRPEGEGMAIPRT